MKTLNTPNSENRHSHSIGVRLQMMDYTDQALVLARLAQARASVSEFTRRQLEEMFEESYLPKPTNLSDTIGKLRTRKLVTRGRNQATWVITPLGRQTSIHLFSDMDLAALVAESSSGSSVLGQVTHTVVLPALAPPSLIPGLRKFLHEHPFERNVFGMTRFPDKSDGTGHSDPVESSLKIAREVCRMHGLDLHLASDRAISDDLWANVAAHMWASQYGIAFFEDRRERKLNYNLTIEVGGMLMTGRRCALLKDTSVQRLPTDLVGQIYKSVDLSKPETVADALHDWARNDLNLGGCPNCKKNQTN